MLWMLNCLVRAPSTHWIGGWMGPRTGLDAVVKRKIPVPAKNWTTFKSELTWYGWRVE